MPSRWVLPLRVPKPSKENHLGVLKRQSELGGGTRRKPGVFLTTRLPTPFHKEHTGPQIWKGSRPGASEALCSRETPSRAPLRWSL